MSFEFTIPGQPPSVNHMYHVVRGTRRLAKIKDVENYQAYATMIARTAKPSGWKYDGGFIRLRYWFEVSRDIDCDNALKALNDAIAIALDVNDRNILPCVIDKVVKSKTPNVRIEVLYP